MFTAVLPQASDGFAVDRLMVNRNACLCFILQRRSLRFGLCFRVSLLQLLQAGLKL